MSYYPRETVEFLPVTDTDDGVEVTTEETGDQRDIIYRVGERTLLARWTVGPDGDAEK